MIPYLQLGVAVVVGIVLGQVLAWVLSLPAGWLVGRVLRARGYRTFFTSLMCWRPSPWEGVASVFAFGQPVRTYNFDPTLDAAALMLDAAAIASDMRQAVNIVADVEVEQPKATSTDGI